jgi:hypothetical protein
MPPPAEERQLTARVEGGEELPVSVNAPQPLDPWLLAESDPGVDFLHEPLSNSNQVPAGVPFSTESSLRGDGLPVIELPVVLVVALEGAGKEAESVNLLFSQALWDKEVSVVALSGEREIPIALRPRERAGELLSIPLPEGESVGQLRVELRPAPESRLERASVNRALLLRDRPPLLLMEAWNQPQGLHRPGLGPAESD